MPDSTRPALSDALPATLPTRRRRGVVLAALPPLAAVLLLAGCNRDGSDNGKAGASGEVIPGSASDAMLPLDTVRSQPPLAPHSGSAGKPAATASDAPEANASDAAPDAAQAGDKAPTKSEDRPEKADPAQ